MKYIKKPSNQFIKEYKLPLGASFAFIIIVVALLFSRTINRIALTDVLGKNSNNDYSKLLSSDKKDNFQKNESIGESTNIEDKTTPAITTPSFTVSPNPATTPPPIHTDPAQTTPPPTPPRFIASVLGFGQSGAQYEYCSSEVDGVSSTHRCFKRYSYTGQIRTLNGPGTVKYAWEGNFDVINSSGSFSVTTAEGYTEVPKAFKLSCSLSGQQIKIKLKTTEPNFSEAPWQDQLHDCST